MSECYVAREVRVDDLPWRIVCIRVSPHRCTVGAHDSGSAFLAWLPPDTSESIGALADQHAPRAGASREGRESLVCAVPPGAPLRWLRRPW